jgi:hypothetical protein
MAAASARQKETPMKVTVPGKTPWERLTNFTKRIVQVPKADVVELERKQQSKKRRKRAPR